MLIAEIQTRRKLSPRALAEIARERAAFRDQVFAARPAVEAALAEAGHADAAQLWGLALERAEGGLVAWLVWLATGHEQPTTLDEQETASHEPAEPAKPRPAVHPPRKHRFGHPGIDQRKSGAFRARCWRDGQLTYSGNFATLEEAVEARTAFLASQQ